MNTKTFDINADLHYDRLASNISAKWQQWNNAKAQWEEKYRRVLQYLYSVTTDTIYGQASAPWAANVHIPKLTQLRDVLITYELESIFSLKDYFRFDGFTEDANTKANRELVRDMLKTIIDDGQFREKIERLCTDYIDAGNSFAIPVWDTRTTTDPVSGINSIEWEGPVATRINPLDIVFDPTAASFRDTPKIIRTVLSIGEVALMAESDPVMKKAFNTAMDRRKQVMTAMTNGDTIKGDQLTIAGFGNLSSYYSSDVVELLTFYGNLYDVERNELHKNTKIVVMDRSVVLKEEPMDDLCGYDYIFHAGFRDRKDNLWSMGPLDNLLGMQARIDFLENKRSDCYDATVNPIKFIRGNIDLPDSLGPGDEIHGDVDTDVKYLAPDTSILTADGQIANYMGLMEEFAGSPKEVLGFRTPGEKTMFEVNQLMTAATRFFHRQIRKFEVEMLEPLMNAMFKMYLKRKQGQKITVKYWDSENEYYTFKEIKTDDINALGKIIVIGSEVAQDKAQMAQALQMLGQNPLFLDEAVRNNFSPAVLGEIFAYVTGLDRFADLLKKNQRLYEITEQQKAVEQLSQQVDEVRAEGLTRAGEASETQSQLAQQRLLGGTNVEG